MLHYWQYEIQFPLKDAALKLRVVLQFCDSYAHFLESIHFFCDKCLIFFMSYKHWVYNTLKGLKRRSRTLLQHLHLNGIFRWELLFNIMFSIFSITGHISYTINMPKRTQCSFTFPKEGKKERENIKLFCLDKSGRTSKEREI